MKRLFSLIVCVLALANFTANAGKIITDSIPSKVLNTVVKYNVYLPDGFDKSDKCYPVVYLLHGLYGQYDNWQTMGNMKIVTDELITSGEAAQMVIIMPNAGDNDIHNIYNGYFNMPDWNYEDFFFQELIPQAEAKYRCISDKGHRAIMGLSMGGGGSTVYCQRHPEMFSSCYAMSAWLDEVSFTEKPEPVNDKFYYTQKSVHEMSAVAFVENADEATVAQLNSVRWFFDCGDDDYLLALSTKIHSLHKKAGINSELRVRNGVHNWEYWHTALRLSLPFASRNFDR